MFEEFHNPLLVFNAKLGGLIEVIWELPDDSFLARARGQDVAVQG
jgi:hypothetical protein